MSNNTWESRYSKTIDNKYRNFNLWDSEEKTYEICNIFCNFKISELDEKDYIKGISATSTSNLLHINPLVDTEPPQRGLKELGDFTGKTKIRSNKIHIQYGFNNGMLKKYELIDIFIKTPSKTVISGKRYQMETCFLFSTEVKDKFLVLCIPMKVSPINETDDILEKDRYEFLMKIANNFPTKGKTYSIEDSPNWNPLVFLPEKNSSFFTWVDPTTNNKVLYIQFENPIKIPYKFFESFANNLSGGVNVAKQLTTLEAKEEHAELDIYYNENIQDNDITTIRTCTEKTNPKTKALINYIKKNKTKKIKDTCEKDKKCDIKCDIKCQTNKVLIFIIIILFIIFIGFIIWYLWPNILSKIQKKII